MGGYFLTEVFNYSQQRMVKQISDIFFLGHNRPMTVESPALSISSSIRRCVMESGVFPELRPKMMPGGMTASCLAEIEPNGLQLRDLMYYQRDDTIAERRLA